MVVAPLVIDLGVMLMFLVALALCLLAKPLVQALFQLASTAVGWIPWLGSRVTGDLHKIEQRITHYLGQAVTKLEARIGVVFHSAARLVEETGSKIAGAFELIFALGAAIALLASWRNVLALYHSLVGQSKATVEKVKTNTQVIHKTTVVVKHVDTKVNTVTTRVQAIPADVVIPGDLAGLRGKVRAAEDDITRLWERVRGFGRTAVEGVGLGALAYALARLRLGWLRCSNVDKVGRRLCGLNPSWLEALLTGAVAIFGGISLVTFAHVLIDAMDEITSAVQLFIQETHGVPSRSAAQQGFAAPGGAIGFRSAGDQGFA